MGRKTEYIEDRKARYKSYHRRRPIPFKKVGRGASTINLVLVYFLNVYCFQVNDMDEYCDTHTLLVQLCEDFDECLYFGPAEMVAQFLEAPEGIRISNLDALILKSNSFFLMIFASCLKRIFAA